jgi:catechol 2,3-dioxygenase-like lactoylglutathione lyase family enzyme
MLTKNYSLLVFLLSATTLFGQQQGGAAAGKIVRPRLLIHVVSNLEKSIVFYRDAVGFDLASGPSPLSGSTLLQKAKATAPAATARQAKLVMPGSIMQLQLIEFSGITGKAFEQRLYDPGVPRLVIQVRDIDKAFENVKDRGIIVDSTSGRPVYPEAPPNNTRAVMMRDLDGFVFEFVQSGTPPQTDAPETSSILNARSSQTTDSFEKSFVFYRNVLGFTFADPPKDLSDTVLALEGTPRARGRQVFGMPPGSNNPWVFYEFRDIERAKRAPNVQDPGASAVSLDAENLPALISSMKAAGIVVETPGGGPVTLEGGRHGALVRSPDGLLVQLIE